MIDSPMEDLFRRRIQARLLPLQKTQRGKPNARRVNDVKLYDPLNSGESFLSERFRRYIWVRAGSVLIVDPIYDYRNRCESEGSAILDSSFCIPAVQ
jgi:hypothetical protein